MSEQEFNKVWLPLNPNLYRLAFYILENEADAWDAVQDLYLKLWTARDSLDDVSNPLAYSIRILRNQCLDRLRRARVRRSEDLDALEQADTGPADGGLSGKEDLARVRKYIGQLPDRQREVLTLRVLEELEYDEIARRMGISQVNVRVTLTIARKTLRQKMEKAS